MIHSSIQDFMKCLLCFRNERIKMKQICNYVIADLELEGTIGPSRILQIRKTKAQRYEMFFPIT